MALEFETVRLAIDQERHLVRLSFDTKTRGNLMTALLLSEMHAALDEILKISPRVLIISGTDKSFSRGADTDAIKSMGAAFQAYITSEFRLFDRVDRLPFVTIAALTGIVIGNASELALSCDFRVATQSSSFSLPETAIGFVAPAQRLARYVGIGVAKDFLFNAKMWKADEAKSHGLISRVLPDAEFEAGLMDFATSLAKMPPIALKATKQGLAFAYGYGDADYPGEEHWAYATYQTADAAEGFASLAEKRPPIFKGN